MEDRGDASFLLGLVLGVVIGAAIVIIIDTALSDPDAAFLPESAGQTAEGKLDKAQDRVEGAAEAAS